jgi:hypothetical protein
MMMRDFASSANRLAFHPKSKQLNENIHYFKKGGWCCYAVLYVGSILIFHSL